jgi:DNA modification methylase
MAAKKLQLSEVPCLVLSHLNPLQKKAYIIADNKLALNAGWDVEMLLSEISELKDEGFDFELTGFSADEIESLTPQVLSVGLTDDDSVPELPVEPITKMGDVWLLGEHRLMCGDSTMIDDVEKLMAGEKADMVFTDPPYGVNYTGGAKKRESLAGDELGTEIYGNALPLLKVAAEDHAALYLWYADAHASSAAAAAAGYVISAQIIWVKNNAQFVSAAKYHGKHEPCFYAHRKGHSAQWFGKNNEVTVWEIDRNNKNEFHPTQKPTALAERAIGNSSQSGDKILDLFGGSGSTLISCEKTNRKCFMMEIAPQYCDVIVKRWEQFTGKKATLETYA